LLYKIVFYKTNSIKISIPICQQFRKSDKNQGCRVLREANAQSTFCWEECIDYLPCGVSSRQSFKETYTYNFCFYGFAVALVESSSTPMGVQLVNSNRANKTSSPNDIVALAMQVQKVTLICTFDYVKIRLVYKPLNDFYYNKVNSLPHTDEILFV
jgi:hypothetical protein